MEDSKILELKLCIDVMTEERERFKHDTLKFNEFNNYITKLQEEYKILTKQKAGQ